MHNLVLGNRIQVLDHPPEEPGLEQDQYYGSKVKPIDSNCSRSVWLESNATSVAEEESLWVQFDLTKPDSSRFDTSVFCAFTICLLLYAFGALLYWVIKMHLPSPLWGAVVVLGIFLPLSQVPGVIGLAWYREVEIAVWIGFQFVSGCLHVVTAGSLIISLWFMDAGDRTGLRDHCGILHFQLSCFANPDDECAFFRKALALILVYFLIDMGIMQLYCAVKANRFYDEVKSYKETERLFLTMLREQKLQEFLYEKGRRKLAARLPIDAGDTSVRHISSDRKETNHRCEGNLSSPKAGCVCEVDETSDE